MNITTITCGIVSTNTYVLTKDDRNCVVIDPGDTIPVLRYLENNQLNCKEILLTHGHFDHIMGLYDLSVKYNPEIWIQQNDCHMLFDNSCFVIPELMIETNKIETCNTFNNETIIETCVGAVLCIATPGHSAGSSCFVIDNERTIFTGDTIFHLGMGRTDFDDSSYTDIISSINNIFLRIPGDYKVYPGHGPSTKLELSFPLG